MTARPVIERLRELTKRKMQSAMAGILTGYRGVRIFNLDLTAPVVLVGLQASSAAVRDVAGMVARAARDRGLEPPLVVVVPHGDIGNHATALDIVEALAETPGCTIEDAMPVADRILDEFIVVRRPRASRQAGCARPGVVFAAAVALLCAGCAVGYVRDGDARGMAFGRASVERCVYSGPASGEGPSVVVLDPNAALPVVSDGESNIECMTVTGGAISEGAAAMIAGLVRGIVTGVTGAVVP